jgi:AraC family transcriptional activator FtrA
VQTSSTVGFDSPATYRHHFTRTMRTTPTAYRRAFRGAGAADGG